MATETSENASEVQKWMEEIARKRKPRKKLVFDKKTKKLIAVSPSDPRADQSLEFTPEEATRFVKQRNGKRLTGICLSFVRPFC